MPCGAGGAGRSARTPVSGRAGMSGRTRGASLAGRSARTRGASRTRLKAEHGRKTSFWALV
jgi:hypothetical protein